jgi:hypothetical protein
MNRKKRPVRSLSVSLWLGSVLHWLGRRKERHVATGIYDKKTGLRANIEIADIDKLRALGWRTAGMTDETDNYVRVTIDRGVRIFSYARNLRFKCFDLFQSVRKLALQRFKGRCAHSKNISSPNVSDQTRAEDGS